ncbi:MAG: type II toxin-antitoxin system VapC family toxin [Spirochaetales bacterium]|nr:type II toxin-antitoxin system VapC family toxin [Spirochaetales bacterium]
MKQRVYIETSIPSYLTARPSNDIRVMANQNITIEWWENRKAEFKVFVSEFVIVESSQGHPEASARRIAAIKDIPELRINEEVKELAKLLITEGPIPKQAEIDAYHIAIATVNGMDYLLTWNCTHIANAVMRPKVEGVCRRHGYEPPVICTPQELMEG